MAVKELREKADALSKRIFELRDKSNDEKREWTAEDESNWETLNADYDRTVKQTERETRCDTIHSFLNAPAGDYSSIARPDFDGREGRDGKGLDENRKDDEKPIHIELRDAEIVLEPGTDEYARESATYRANFSNHLRGIETRDLQVGKDSKGGYLAPATFVARLIKFLDDLVFMRGLSTVLPPIAQGVSLGVPSLDTDVSDADWTAEVPAADLTEDTSIAFGKRELTPHLITKLVKISNKLLRSAVLSVDSIVRERIGYKFAVTEEKAFLDGDGAQKPLGIFTASADGISTGRDVTGGSATNVQGDDFIDLKFSLKAQYQRNSTLVIHRDTVKRVRKLKDGNGQYLWAPGLAGGEPGTIVDVPYRMSEFAPNTFTTGLYVAVMGDFRAGYWIADSLGMEIQTLNELFALRNQIGILGRKETDGMPVLEEAFARLKLA